MIELAGDDGRRARGEPAAPPGLEPEPARTIPATQEHVGSEVVLLRG